MTLTCTVKSKRRQNGGAACVATVKKAYYTLWTFFSAASCHFCQCDMAQIVPEKCLKFSDLFLKKFKQLWKVMML